MYVDHNIDFLKASFKDFEVTSNLNAFERAGIFHDFTDYMEEHGQINYRFVTSGLYTTSKSQSCCNCRHIKQSIRTCARIRDH